MSRAVNDIAQRLSLRTPQREALDRLASLVERRGGEPEVLPLVRRVPRAMVLRISHVAAESIVPSRTWRHFAVWLSIFILIGIGAVLFAVATESEEGDK